MRPVYLLALPLLVLAAPACTEKKAPPPPVPVEEAAPATLRDRAEAVGAVGDATVTSDLTKGLTGAVDASAQRAKELEEANQ